MTDLASLRKSYERAELSETDSHADPLQQFSSWLNQAISAIACKAVDSASIFDAILQLVAKSLLLAEMANEVVHYRLLNSTRAYALEKLQQSDEFLVVRERYARYRDMRLVKPSRSA